jgi:hypothetical protein
MLESADVQPASVVRLHCLREYYYEIPHIQADWKHAPLVNPTGGLPSSLFFLFNSFTPSSHLSSVRRWNETTHNPVLYCYKKSARPSTQGLSNTDGFLYKLATFARGTARMNAVSTFDSFVITFQINFSATHMIVTVIQLKYSAKQYIHLTVIKLKILNVDNRRLIGIGIRFIILYLSIFRSSYHIYTTRWGWLKLQEKLLMQDK